MGGYRTLVHFLAEITVDTLELIGIFIIIVGSFRALVQLLIRLRTKQPINIMIELGRALALGLEFKMGAEIVNTVIVREIRELLILGLVILLRAILAILIHWEIKNERRDEKETEMHARSKADSE
ncbi:MAG: DUF1622 domain-containing protein [Clostridia bacterium]|nr:DUF1622 domain-containing protein [Clostridia bacterium]